MVRPEGVEPPTYWFVASCSIQLSYGRTCFESKSTLSQLSKDKGFRFPEQLAHRVKTARLTSTARMFQREMMVCAEHVMSDEPAARRA